MGLTYVLELAYRRPEPSVATLRLHFAVAVGGEESPDGRRSRGRRARPVVAAGVLIVNGKLDPADVVLSAA